MSGRACRSAAVRLPLPSKEKGQERMVDRVSNFLGGSPVGVLVRLILISLIVGFVLPWLDWSPRDILFRLEDLLVWAWHSLFGSMNRAVDYFLLGAAIVFPLFLISRLLKSGRR